MVFKMIIIKKILAIYSLKDTFKAWQFVSRQESSNKYIKIFVEIKQDRQGRQVDNIRMIDQYDKILSPGPL